MSHRLSRDNNHAAYAGSWHSQRRPASIGELAEKALEHDWDPSREFKHCLRMAELARNQAWTSLKQGDLEIAFMLFARAADLALDKLATHPNYATSLTELQRHNLGLNGQEILDRLSEIKPELVNRFTEWRTEHPDEELTPLERLDWAARDLERAFTDEVRERQQDEEARSQRQSARHQPPSHSQSLQQPALFDRREEDIRGSTRQASATPVYQLSAPNSPLSRPPNHVYDSQVEVEAGSEVEIAHYEDASAFFKRLAIANSEATQNVQGHSDHLHSDKPKVQTSGDDFVSAPAQDSEEGVAQLLHARVLSSKDSYKSLLEAKDAEAQKILDLLQNLLNSPRVVGDKVRGSILTALLRLSASSGLYPQQLRLQDIEKESSPVTAGQFGEIWKGEYHGRPVCLKIFKLYQRSEIAHLLKRCSREAIVWSQLVHPNLLPFYGIYHLGDAHGRVGLVSPWMGNGNLTEYLKAHPTSRRLPFVHDILAGLRYLHRHQVVHGDLKGVNILITADGSACLADFGLSSVMDADVLRWTSLVTITQIGGTVRWMAPEMIEAAEDGLSHPTLESDIYSLASVMFEAFTGQVPYYEFPRDLTVLSKVTQGIKPRRPSNEVAPELTDPVWKIMIDCWSGAPSDRPTIDQVISDISVQKINASRPQPAQVELRNLRSPAGTLTKSDMTFLMNLLNVG